VGLTNLKNIRKDVFRLCNGFKRFGKTKVYYKGEYIELVSLEDKILILKFSSKLKEDVKTYLLNTDEYIYMLECIKRL
jgi:hypothetical protein